jgi:hypothetical protein
MCVHVCVCMYEKMCVIFGDDRERGVLDMFARSGGMERSVHCNKSVSIVDEPPLMQWEWDVCHALGVGGGTKVGWAGRSQENEK